MATRVRVRFLALILLAVGQLLGCGGELSTSQVQRLLEGLEPGVYAIIATNYGPIAVRLYSDRCPRTVANFVGLAEGVRPWIETKSMQPVKRPFYDGLIFHRVAWSLLIQGGDPLGLGYGGPGYTIADEIVPGLKFDKPGLVGMANSGPNTTGSQFFITVRAAPELDGKFNMLGEVVKGTDVVDKINNMPVYRMERPVREVVMRTVRIYRLDKDGSIVKSPPPPDIDIQATPLKLNPAGAPGAS